MKPSTKFLAAAALSTFIMVLGIGFNTQFAVGMEPPFGTKTDTEYSKALWDALVSAKLVGPNSINTKPYEGVHPHGAILQTLESKVTVNGRTAHVVVKKNHAGKEGLTENDVWQDPNKYLGAITVMFKREAGYDPDNQDWFWVKYKADGSLHKNPKGMMLAGKVAKGAPAGKGCINCHQKAGGGDYFFIND